MITGIFKKQVPKHPINPRFRAYGKARLDIARRAANGSDWDRLWKEPAFPFPFDWGEWWKQCIEYKVEDFAAEVGFYTDILGLPVVAFDPNYAMFTSPSQDFFLAVVPAGETGKSTPTDALRIQFMVADIFETVSELERRGIVFEQKPLPCEKGSSMYITYFRTPHGLCVDLWGIVPQEERISSRREADTADFGLRQERVRREREEIKSPALDQDFTERERAEPEGYFEEEAADEEEDSAYDSNTGFRFFVEPASEFAESGEGETGTEEELNFGVPASEEPVKAPRQPAGFGEEEQLDEEEEELDEEDDDSSPYEYIYVDDV